MGQEQEGTAGRVPNSEVGEKAREKVEQGGSL